MSRKAAAWSVLVPTCLSVALAVLCVGQGAPPTTPPLGATPSHTGTTFRVWAPFADAVSVKVNDGQPVPLNPEDAHARPEDAVWRGDVPGAKVGDRYQYLIRAKGTTAPFIDP